MVKNKRFVAVGLKIKTPYQTEVHKVLKNVDLNIVATASV